MLILKCYPKYIIDVVCHYLTFISGCMLATSTHSSHGAAGLMQRSPPWCKRGRNKTT